MSKILAFIKKEIVFSVSFVLALVSSFIVRPALGEVNSFLDYKTLCLLFCLMFIVKGFEKCHVFEYMASLLLKKITSLRMLYFVLVFMCFFTAMFITNDVALITFVPFSIYLCRETKKEKHIIMIVVLQTIAANLGSMLLPIGNPQNLYIFSASGMDFSAFVAGMFPVWLVSLLLLILVILPVKKEELSAQIKSEKPGRLFIPFLVLFLLSMATVIGVLPYQVLLLIVLACGLIASRETFKRVDYVLLLTFVCFFIFIGNMKAIPAVTDMMKDLVGGRELLVGVVSSQVISNVPAAILLFSYSLDYRALLWGVDIGGLGTLIASLASLISYKLYSASNESNTGRYMAVFTGLNLAFLAVLLVFANLAKIVGLC